MAKPKKGGFGGNIFGQSETSQPEKEEVRPQEEEPKQEQPKMEVKPIVSPPKTEEKKRTRYTIMIEEELLQNVKLFATLKRRKIYEIFEVALAGYLDKNFTEEHRKRLEELQSLE